MLTPERIFTTLNGYQAARALEAAIKLDLFTALDAGARTASEVGAACEAQERGARILLDYLVIQEFLEKKGDRYSLTEESRFFLSRRSPAYLGSVIGFLSHHTVVSAFDDLTAVVRRGGTVLPGEGTVDPDNPIWVDFARAMAPMMHPASVAIPKLLKMPEDKALKVLDIAAGHGKFGIEVAKQFPNARITALDWPNVLAVAKENAERAGIGSRYSVIPGNAFEVPFQDRYDVILITNFLHHFDRPACENFLKKIKAALTPEGRAVTLEFVPNEDRTTPPAEAAFSIIMLATTQHGDAYTFSELAGMFKAAGFVANELHALHEVPQHVIISR